MALAFQGATSSGVPLPTLEQSTSPVGGPLHVQEPSQDGSTSSEAREQPRCLQDRSEAWMPPSTPQQQRVGILCLLVS